MLPLADQSMPYNVISITGTLVALFSGSMFNLLTRHGGGRPPHAPAAASHAATAAPAGAGSGVSGMGSGPVTT